MVHIVCESGTLETMVDTAKELGVFTFDTCQLIHNICAKALDFEEENKKLLHFIDTSLSRILTIMQETCPEEVYIDSKEITEIQTIFQELSKKNKDK